MWKKFGAPVVLVALLLPAARGQVPAVPAAAVPVAPAAAGPLAAAPAAAVVPAAGPPAGTKIANLIATCAYCKAKFCASPVGQFFNNSLAPIRVFSGGILGNCCPDLPTAAQLAAPADSPTGAAALVKADEAAAKARRADVRYLGTVDCRYWPEAQEALINALRRP